MSRVFILEPTRVAVDAACEYGDVVYVFEQDEKRPSIFSSAFRPALRRQMEALEYNSKEDYILVAGAQANILVFITEVMHTHGGPIQALIFNAPTHAYSPLLLGGENYGPTRATDLQSC